jgi:hypothetical protein
MLALYTRKEKESEEHHHRRWINIEHLSTMEEIGERTIGISLINGQSHTIAIALDDLTAVLRGELTPVNLFNGSQTTGEFFLGHFASAEDAVDYANKKGLSESEVTVQRLDRVE